MNGQFHLWDVPSGNHGNLFFNEDKYPVQDDEYNCHDSLQTYLIEVARIKGENRKLPIAYFPSVHVYIHCITPIT